MEVKKNKRLLNFLIDFVVVVIIILSIESYAERHGFMLTETAERIIFLAVYFGYYFVFEVITGRTLGKLITQTKVVLNDGSEPGITKILIRSAVRLLNGLEMIIFIGSGFCLHDKLSRTKVVEIYAKPAI